MHKIGYNFHGVFDPNHADFNTLFNKSVTQRSAKILSLVDLAHLVLVVVVFAALRLFSVAVQAVVFAPFVALLAYGVLKDNYRLMLPVIFVLELRKLVCLANVVLMLWAAANPFSKLFDMVTDVLATDSWSECMFGKRYSTENLL